MDKESRHGNILHARRQQQNDLAENALFPCLAAGIKAPAAAIVQAAGQ